MVHTHAARAAAARHHARGFSLVEVAIVLVIVALLAGMAIPGASRLVSGARASATLLELRGLLELARQHAVSYGTTVTLCGTNDGTRCAASWQGRPTLVFVDGNDNRARDPQEQILALAEFTRTGSMRWRASGGRAYLRYTATGGVLEYGSFTYCPADGNARAARQIIVSSTGRARAATDQDGDGIVEDRDGRPVSCAG